MINSKSVGIAVFCFKRAAKLKQSMEALLANPEASQMDVVFFGDGPRNEQDDAGIAATRAYINSLTGFKSITTFFSETNLSTGPNFQRGLTYMRDNFSRFIVVEDDLVVSSNFLAYMLSGLDFYENSKSVFCVTGFAFPLNVKKYRYDTIIHNRFCSYGWGTWSNRFVNIKWSAEELETLIHKSPGFRSRLNREGLDLFRMVKKQIKGKISTWDIQMQVHVSENKLKVVYPSVSKTVNIGFDNESTNTFGVDYLKTKLDVSGRRSFRFINHDAYEPSMQSQLRRPYSLPALATRKIMNVLIKLTNTGKKSAEAI